MKGLLDTEDRWFYYHPGFNPIRIVEAALNDLRRHHLSQGAGTVTQQLARTFMDRHERSFSRKFRELAVALVIEFRLTKNAILKRYINDVPMGEYDGTPIEGMPLAARYFFNKDLREVTAVEAATLIGMIQAPTAYDPRRHPEQCRKRRDTVLVIMRVDDLIDQPTYTAATTSPVQVAKMPGLRRAPYFTDYVTAFVKRIPGLDGHLDGLKVYTTLDTEYQADAQEALESNLARLEKSRPRLRRKDDKDRLEERDGGARRDLRRDCRDGGWPRLCREPVQSRHPGRAPARFGLQANCLSGRDGSGPLSPASAADAGLGAAR